MTQALWTLDDLTASDLKNHRVLVRVDFNVPLEDGRVTDTTRLDEALPTLRELREAGARVVLISHCGRPKGLPDPRYSLRPVAEKLGEILGETVVFGDDCVGEKAHEAIAKIGAGGVCLLENLRFHADETKNGPDFAARLAELADVYVDDAFGSAHRAHASVVGVAERVPKKAAGRLMVREVEALGRLLGEPERPFVAILGGAKIEGKIDTLVNLLPRLDVLLVGGGMANTFLVARGHALGGSLVESERIEMAAEILERAAASKTEILLPVDVVTTDSLDSPTAIETVAMPDGGGGAIPDGRMAVDIGPATRACFAEHIARAKTLFWNGPMGVFEKKPFDAGTQAVAESLARCPGFTVLGGGETVAAAGRAGVVDQIGHVSTGGGASLELLAGKILPGVAALAKS